MATKLVIAVAILVAATGCGDEKPSTVSRDRLAFLDQQAEPLLLQAVGKHMGSTPPGHGPHGPTFAGSRDGRSAGTGPALMDPYFGYRIRETDAFIEFWMNDAPIEQEITIFMVVERSPGVKSHIIWPKRLVGTDPHDMMKKEWPKMYQ